ncbi:MAG: acyl-CoA thioesterase [Hyphomicrobiaceae bacterium]|nr:acyl-CoA thioesterase [Hyphomicrobiaceae bacterium]
MAMHSDARPQDATPPEEQGFTHKRAVRIEWGDCDPAGIVFNPRFFEMFDAATAGLFEAALGVHKRAMLEQTGCAGIPLKKTSAEFFRPLRFGDDAVIESTIWFGRTSFRVRHRVMHNDELCAEGSEVRVWTVRGPEGQLRASPPPEDVARRFKAGRGS